MWVHVSVQEAHPNNGEQVGCSFLFFSFFVDEKGCCASMDEVDGLAVLCDLPPAAQDGL